MSVDFGKMVAEIEVVMMDPAFIKKFPEVICAPSGSIKLVMATTNNTAELWQLVKSDRTNSNRKMVWPGQDCEQDLRKYLAGASQANPPTAEWVYLIFAGHQIVGTMHVHDFNWVQAEAEVGYWIHHQFEGQGLISMSLKMVEEVLRSRGFKELKICCDCDNVSSRRVAERNHFSFQAVHTSSPQPDGSFKDEAIYKKQLG